MARSTHVPGAPAPSLHPSPASSDAAPASPPLAGLVLRHDEWFVRDPQRLHREPVLFVREDAPVEHLVGAAAARVMRLWLLLDRGGATAEDGGTFLAIVAQLHEVYALLEVAQARAAALAEVRHG